MFTYYCQWSMSFKISLFTSYAISSHISYTVWNLELLSLFILVLFYITTSYVMIMKNNVCTMEEDKENTA